MFGEAPLSFDSNLKIKSALQVYGGALEAMPTSILSSALSVYSKAGNSPVSYAVSALMFGIGLGAVAEKFEGTFGNQVGGRRQRRARPAIRA